VSYRLLVFDWDGTIIDSAATIAECIRDASRELGLEVPDRQRASHVIGLGLHDAMRIAVPGLAAERYPEFVASYRKHFLVRKDSMQLFDGMRPLLEGLSKRHVLAIATGKSRGGLDRDLEFHQLKPLFAASRCAASAGTARRIASCSRRPMTCLARSRSGTSRPSSRLASRIQSAIVAAESMIVPSQSKTRSR